MENDILKIKSKFTKLIVDYFLSKAIKKYLGINADVRIRNLDVEIGDRITVDISAHAECDKSELEKIKEIKEAINEG